MTNTSILLKALNGIIMLALPFLAGMFLLRRSRGRLRVFWIGAAGFILSQVGHIPFNQFLLLPGLERWGIDLFAQSGWSLLILGIAAGLSAGLFEESARYLIFRFWLKDERNADVPWKYGVGHGGIESIFTGVLVLYALVQVFVLSGEGALEGFPADQVVLIESQLEAYWAVPWHQALLGAWERVSAVLFHLGASVFVFKSVREKKPFWVLIAILGHTILNAFAVVAVNLISLVLVELLLFLFALLWIAWAWLVRPRELQSPGLQPPPTLQDDFPAPQITDRQLEESRYE